MKPYLKTIGIIIAVIVVAIAIFFGTEYYRYRQSPDYVAEQYFKQLEEAYKNDTYGGSTPEETLQLFIDALKKGDTELASKYFIVEKQQEWRRTLENWKEANKLSEIITILEMAGYGSELRDGVYQLTVANERNEATFIINLIKNNASLKWKLREF